MFGVFFVFCVAGFFFLGLLTSKIGATDGQDWGATWLHLHTPFALERNAFSCLFFFFSLTLFLPSVWVFDFAFNLVWLAVNGAWLVLGINDMTRDTPLLEFSQVRATPIDGTPPPLCLPSRWMNASLLSPSFCCSFNLSKKEMDTKELIRGDMKMGEGERGSPGQMRRRAAQPECAFECMRGLRVNSQLWPAARSPLRSGTWQGYRPKSLQHTLALARSSGRSLIGLTHRALARGCRRWGAAPQWISGWHGGGSLLGVCALPRVPACLF